MATPLGGATALRLAGALTWFWLSRGYTSEGRRWLDRALAADRLSARGLEVERFSDRLAATLTTMLPPTATASNPVDIAGAGEADIVNFERIVRVIAQSGEADRHAVGCLVESAETAHGLPPALPLIW